jgi:hypothetical protein
MKKNILLIIVIILFHQSVLAFTGNGAAPVGLVNSFTNSVFKTLNYSQAIYDYEVDSLLYGYDYWYFYSLFYGVPDTTCNCGFFGSACTMSEVQYINEPAVTEVLGNYFGYIVYQNVDNRVCKVYLNSNYVQPNFVYDTTLLWHLPILITSYDKLVGCFPIVALSFVTGLGMGLIIKIIKNAVDKTVNI